MEEEKKQRGGKRPGAGRPSGLNKTLISLKLDNDLLASFKANSEAISNRNQYINDAIRQALRRDKFL